ncbi:MAG: hypothetical protein NWE77_01470 [Candidatus Bathyarchaeota archaeon]|nr:hypothetical protein [Candidatus Bathyarchaeota archaeon]
MKREFWRTKRFAILLATIILIPALFLLALRIDFALQEQTREDAVLEYFLEQEGMPEAFAQLKQLTQRNSVVLCWWDYGRAVREWSQREVIEAYPSRDIWYTVGSTRSLLGNLEAQLFGTWGSSERIHDLARMFLLSEQQSLPVMKKYNVQYALVFVPDDLQKFNWIAEIAGYDGTDYLVLEDDNYQPTELGSQSTLLRLVFDDMLLPQHFDKLFDNGKGKIYQVGYP